MDFIRPVVLALFIAACSPSPTIPAQVGHTATIPFHMVFESTDDGRYSPRIPVKFFHSTVAAGAAKIPAGDWTVNGESMIQPRAQYTLVLRESGFFEITDIE